MLPRVRMHLKTAEVLLEKVNIVIQSLKKI